MQKKILTAILSLFTTAVYAQAIQGIQFSHKDWELACDNTGTCRMAGYQAEDDVRLISILFTREAGENTALHGKIRLDEISEDPAPFNSQDTELWVNHRSLGKLEFKSDSANEDPTYFADLNEQQTRTVLDNLKGVGSVEARSGNKHWKLSDQGSTAVMLKMDEFQQRINKPSALLKVGNDQAPVLAPQPKPLLKMVEVPSGETALAGDSPQAVQLVKMLRTVVKQDDCYTLFNDEEFGSKQYEVSVYPLNDQYKLVSAVCIMGSYQMSSAYAIMDNGLQQIKELVTTEASDYADGVLYGDFKGRGLGDCRSMTQWVWNGQHFVKSLESSTGQCKSFIGGAWELPIWVSDVVK